MKPGGIRTIDGVRFAAYVGHSGPLTLLRLDRYHWVCDCADYDLAPAPDSIGECQRCFRLVPGARTR